MTLLDTQPLVRVLGTGGAIHSFGHGPLDFHNYGIPDKKLDVNDLLTWLPEGYVFPRVKAEQVFQLGSPSIGAKEWIELAGKINGIFAEDPETAGIVVTHGTSTLEETAFFLHLTVKSDRPVVLTGSMRPPSALGSDAPVNFIDALRVAASPDSRGKGVLMVLNNQIQSARDVRKGNGYRVETFHSGEFGILGYADSDHEVVYYRAPTRKHTFAAEFDVSGLTDLPRVVLVHAHAGGDGLLVRAAIDAGVDGIVSAGVGAGGGSPDYGTALQEAAAKGIPVVQSSHVGTGRVMMTERWKPHGFIAADTISPKKARILLALGLTVTKDRDKLQAMFETY
ncbi:MAG: asparaginase [Chloroflexi bacterium]|nr:asparaginase [Chloroflexota bacterium]